MHIDTTTYNKAQRIPYNPKKACGYQPRPLGRLSIRSILDHTTNGHAGTSLEQEAAYIANSREISSHYLIGKEGDIIDFLDPLLYIAYHAGCVRSMAFSNPFSIGIEMHNTPVEGHCSIKQLESLDWLVRDLITRFNIQKKYIETQRAVAIYCKGHPLAGQLGRKIAPSGFPDSEFYAWRELLYTPVPVVKTYEVIADSVNIRTAPFVGNNIAGKLYKGDISTSIAQKRDEHKQYIKGTDIWAHLTKGVSQGKDVSGLGFVHTSNLKLIG